jgi:CDP-diacylglycerol--serine O-phosphatidyltransferase
MITFTSLICAFTAVVLAAEQRLLPAGYCIITAYILDAFDGEVARRLGVSSSFGIQLDSLVDIVALGMGPSIVMYQHLVDLGMSAAIAWGAGMIFMVGGAFRLARFNLQPEKQSHSDTMGLTISTSGATLTLSVLANVAYGNDLIPPAFYPAIAVLLMLLMISRISYPPLARIVRRSWVTIVGIAGIVAISIWLTPQLVWFAILGGYASFGAARALVRAF